MRPGFFDELKAEGFARSYHMVRPVWPSGGDERNDWLDQSQHETTPAELRSFATGLQADQAAVREALRSPWSNGQVEGHVNRLKTLKRQVYGWAKFGSLRKRFLWVA